MSRASVTNINGMVDHLFRKEAGKLTAVLIRRFGFRNFELIEDIVQETFLTALKTWPNDEIPGNPSAWLMQVAKNKTLNALKKESRTFHPKKGMEDIRSVNGTSTHPGEHAIDKWFLDHHIRDSQLRVLFTCCHPSYAERARIMLALKALAGFSYTEISRALLVNEENVRKTLYRIRNHIRSNEETLKKPARHQIPERLYSVLTTLYLMFNEGYKRTDGDDVLGKDLCFEAMRLTKLLTEKVPDSAGQIDALMALMCLNAARFSSRTDSKGNIVDLKIQDRSLWDQSLIHRGFYYLKESRKSDQISRYHIEAGISAVHCTASSFEQTDWKKILYYYNRLKEMVDTPIIKINRAIALSYVKSVKTGLKVLEHMSEPQSESYCHYHAAKGDMYYRLGIYHTAELCFKEACRTAKSVPEKKFLNKRIQKCRDQSRTGNSIDFPNLP